MKDRFLYLLRLLLVLLLFFALQKTVFFYTNAECSQTAINCSDLFQIILYGLGLDFSTSGYLMVIPFLIVWSSLWYGKLKHQSILRPYFIVISILLASICIMDTSLYAFWKFKLDATIFNYTDSPKQALASVSGGYVLWRVVLTLVFTILLSYILIRIKPHKFSNIKFGPRLIGYNIVFVIIGGLIFLAIRGGVGRSTMNVGNAYFSENTYLNHAAINPAFNLIYSWRKNEDFSEKYNYLDENKRTEIFNSLYPKDTEDCDTVLLKVSRPQVLIIILEGFGSDYVASLGGVPNAAPNIERLIKEGIFFNNVYANSFRTDRGLVSTLSGHISYPTTSIMKIPAKSGRLPGIAASLADKGYQTEFIYGGDINFTNMRSYFTSTGYKKIVSDTDFSIAERTSSSWGAHDEYAFNKTYEIIKSMPQNQRWHIGLLTLSSHEPFEVPYDRLTDKRQNAFAYTDACLGAFIDKLKALPVWKDLLVVCIPDHGSSPTFNITSPTFYHIPMLWLGGAIKEPKVISTLMSQSDLPATLLAQLGIDHQAYVYSRNIFSREYDYPFAYSTYSDGFMFKDSTGTTFYDNAARKVVHSSPSDNAVRTEKGMAILQTSYDRLSHD